MHEVKGVVGYALSARIQKSIPHSAQCTFRIQGVVGYALYVQLQQPIPLGVLLDFFYTSKYNIQIASIKKINGFVGTWRTLCI